MSVMGGVQMDFGFSFDAVPTIDTVLYWSNRDGWTKTEETRGHKVK